MTQPEPPKDMDWQHASAIIQGSDDAIISKTIHGIITSWNPGAERTFGYSAEEAIGQPMLMLFPEDRVHEEAVLLERIKTGERLKNFETVRRHKDGHLMEVSVTLSPMLDGAGQVIGASKIARDISEHKRAEWLEVEKQRAERAAEARTAFLANVSHELRTPMNVILGHTQLLLDSSLSPAQNTQLQTVHQSALFMLRLVNDLLDISRLDKGLVSLETTPVDLTQLLTEMTATYEAMAASKKLDFTLTTETTLPPLVGTDPLRLRQILTNVISNAIKFTQTGSVNVRVGVHTPHMLHCQVTDTGVGMDTDEVARIFEPLTQADESHTRRFGGAGLGAAIAKQLAKLMGGTLSVQSQKGVGTTVNIAIPVPPHASVEPVANHPPLEATDGIRPLRTLIVDDMPLNLKLLSLIMEKQGHQVVAVDSGAAAIEAMAHDTFDLVLMDVQMPGMTGLEATQRIRTLESQHHRHNTPVVAVTASVLLSDREAAQRAGMDGFVSKPIKIPELSAEIKRVLLSAPFSRPRH